MKIMEFLRSDHCRLKDIFCIEELDKREIDLLWDILEDIVKHPSFIEDTTS